eukprot:CAMPEP_0168823128 /NCGR_PEP_ID=MMETSP0726-20121227/10361_1 /TAXON_ID=265536 /ORGANISM="Amphiprora sp., Strain CCMP467" /LENGTH=406 /DNA_ID=CAMNT_0008875973 /DNA_START=614 /DNA_END=1831 /DNA_ORIENTATION=-
MVVGTMFGDYLRRKRGVCDIDKGTPCYGNLELYAIFVPPRKYLRKRRRTTTRSVPTTPTSPPDIHRMHLRPFGGQHMIPDYGYERDREAGSQNPHEVMRALFQCMKRTEKSRSNLLQLPRDKLSKELKEHSDKLLHQNITRKKLIRTFREELGSALLDKLKKDNASDSSDDSTCLSSPKTSPYNSPSRISRDSPSRRHSPYYESPSQQSFSSSSRTSFSPRHHTPPKNYTPPPNTDGIIHRQPTESPSLHSPNQYSPGQYQQRTPLKSSLRRVAQYASTRRTSHYLSPGDESSKADSPRQDKMAEYPSPNGQWQHNQTSPHTSPPRISCVSSASTASTSPQSGHSPSSLKSPNRVSPYKSPNRVTFALEMPAHPDSPKQSPSDSENRSIEQTKPNIEQTKPSSIPA